QGVDYGARFRFLRQTVHHRQNDVAMGAQSRFEAFALVLRDNDDVAVLRRPIRAGTELLCGSEVLTITRDIPAGHKVAVRRVADADPVRKYGQIIGFARGEIQRGDHVHTHNLAMKEFTRDYGFCSEAKPVELIPEAQMRSFQGYARPGGRAGTRN